MPTGHRPASVDAVLAQLRADPGRPRLTWYGPSGERVELSGHVLDNWVAKIANLLVEELDAGPGTMVELDLPLHWRTVTWALAAWRVGAGVSARPAGDGRPGVVVTDAPERHPDATDVVAVSLPALARRFDGVLPRGAVDAATAVMTYGDVLSWAPEPDPRERAVEGHDVEVAHADLIAWARSRAGDAVVPDRAEPETPRHDPVAGARVLLEAPAGRSTAGDLGTVLGVLADDGSVVLCAPEVGQGLRDDPARRERLLATERVTAAVLP